ncbi:MAG: RnfABCDGE type electron transport complex subunit D, partial [Spirochaetales bacterium]
MRKTYKNITPAPFCYLNLSINQMIKVFIFCLIPHIVMLVITSSTQSITLLMITVSAAYISELLYNAIYRKDFIFSWETLLQGILIGLFIPAAYPGMIAFSITFFVLLLQKVIFSDFAQSWANPIVFVLIVIYFFAP